jgi:O-antigen/teichoic acid export membrane protein
VKSSLLTLVKQSLVYGLSGAAIQAVGLVTLPVFAREFTAAQYGVLEIATVAFTAMIVAVDAGLGSALHRNWFEIHEDREDERRLVASTATISSTALALIIAGGLIVARGPLAQWLFNDRAHADIVVLVALSLPLATLAIFCRDVMRVRFRPGHFAVSSALAAVIAAAVSVTWVLAFGGGVATVVAGILAGQAVAAGYGLLIVRRDLPLRFSGQQLRSLLSFGMPLVPAAAATWAISFMDRILLSKLDGLAATGEYAIGTRFAAVLLFVTGAFGTAYTPFLFSAHAADPEHERALRGRLLIYAAVTFLTVGVALTLFAREIAYLVAPGYDRAYQVVGILCLSAAAFGLSPIAAAGIGIARQTGYVARYTLMALIVNVALCFALIPTLGLVGAAIATAGSNVLLAIAYLVRSQRLVPIDLPVAKLVRAFLLAAAFMPLGLLPTSPEGLVLAGKAAALAVCVGGYWVLGVLGPAETTELRRILGRLRTRATPAA